MKLHEIREFIKLVNQSSIEELEWEMGGTSLVIKKAAPVLAISEQLPVQANEIESGYQEAAASTDSAEKEVQAPIEPAPQRVVSPTVGLFYAAVAIGQKVKSGELVGRCTVDTLQLSQDIYSPVDGEIVNILVTDGQLVDYGKELLVVKQS
jgi:acetyl-CoA carboxylase biotin carboxyl carrier protein